MCVCVRRLFVAPTTELKEQTQTIVSDATTPHRLTDRLTGANRSAQPPSSIQKQAHRNEAHIAC